jgi:hypothetical protein
MATAEEAGVLNEACLPSVSEDTEVTERVRCTIVTLTLPPPRQTAGGWRGADWDQKSGKGKVVEGDLTVVLSSQGDGAIFAVCPKEARLIDALTVLLFFRVENAKGNHIFNGLAFNERNDAFDFNVSGRCEERRKPRRS